MSGIFGITRSIWDHPLFKNEPFTEREAWIWLIGEAAWQPTRVRVNRRAFDLQRGQLVHAVRFMGERWQWPKSKVARFLDRLKNDRMIGTLANPDATIITICKYDDYQLGRDAPGTLTGTLAGHSRDREEELEEGKNLGGGGCARAREGGFRVSQEALAFADELTQIAGHDPSKIESLSWFNSQPGVRIQTMLNDGWKIEIMRETAERVMRSKRDGPPGSIKYFEKPFARAHAPQLPLPPVQVVKDSSNVEEFTSHRSAQVPSSWHASRDRWRVAAAKLNASVAADKARRADEGTRGDGDKFTATAGRDGP